MKTIYAVGEKGGLDPKYYETYYFDSLSYAEECMNEHNDRAKQDKDLAIFWIQEIEVRNKEENNSYE